MIPSPPQVRLRRKVTHRLIASRFPSAGILDQVASPADLDAVFELEGWTNDRITTELGILLRIPKDEWAVGTPMSSVVMAAFCHPRVGGGRFNDEARGAWYGSFTLDTAHAEVAYHRGRELAEIGVTDARMEMREYVAETSGPFHDIRTDAREYRPLYDPESYVASQRFALDLLASGFERDRLPVRAPRGRNVPRVLPSATARPRPGCRPLRVPVERQRPALRSVGSMHRPTRSRRSDWSSTPAPTDAKDGRHGAWVLGRRGEPMSTATASRVTRQHVRQRQSPHCGRCRGAVVWLRDIECPGRTAAEQSRA